MPAKPPHTFAFVATPPPSPFTLFPYTTLFRSCVPCSVSLPASPSTEPVSAASIVNVSAPPPPFRLSVRSEEHTSELQSRVDLVCRLLLEKKTPLPAPSS